MKLSIDFKTRNLAMTFGVALVALALILLAFAGTQSVSASREEALPVQNILYNSASITQATNFTGKIWATGLPVYFSRADIFYNIDVGSAQAITFTLQFSADGSNWFTATDRADSIAFGTMGYSADTLAYTTTRIVGTYFRLRADVSTSNAITPVIRVVLH